MTARCQGFVTIDGGMESDGQWVCDRIRQRYNETGHQPIMLGPESPMLFARNAVTNEPLACITIKPLPTGVLYAENLLAVPGRKGKMAVRALLERLLEMPMRKVCAVAAHDPNILKILGHYGLKVIGFTLEGPMEV